MYTNVDIPENTLSALTTMARAKGLTRASLIRKVLVQFTETDFPVEDCQFTCHECHGGQHCGGGERMIADDINNAKRGPGKMRRLRWLCVCPVCVAAQKEVVDATI